MDGLEMAVWPLLAVCRRSRDQAPSVLPGPVGPCWLPDLELDPRGCSFGDVGTLPGAVFAGVVLQLRRWGPMAWRAAGGRALLPSLNCYCRRLNGRATVFRPTACNPTKRLTAAVAPSVVALATWAPWGRDRMRRSGRWRVPGRLRCAPCTGALGFALVATIAVPFPGRFTGGIVDEMSAEAAFPAGLCSKPSGSSQIA